MLNYDHLVYLLLRHTQTMLTTNIKGEAFFCFAQLKCTRWAGETQQEIARKLFKK